MSQVLRLENIFCIGKTDFFAILGSFLPLSFFDFFFFFSFLFYPVLWGENRRASEFGDGEYVKCSLVLSHMTVIQAPGWRSIRTLNYHCFTQ
jgi:hypothetical protein